MHHSDCIKRKEDEVDNIMQACFGVDWGVLLQLWNWQNCTEYDSTLLSADSKTVAEQITDGAKEIAKQ